MASILSLYGKRDSVILLYELKLVDINISTPKAFKFSSLILNFESYSSLYLINPPIPAGMFIGWFAMIIYPSLDVKNKAQQDATNKIRAEIQRIKSLRDHGNAVEGGNWPIEVNLDACRNF